FRSFFKKFHPYQWLDHLAVSFSLQEVKARVQADSLHAVCVADVKLLIFQPQTQRAEVCLSASAPREIGPVVIDGKKRRIGVAIEVPPRSPRFPKNIYKGQGKGHE